MLLCYGALKMGRMVRDYRPMPQRTVETAHFGILILDSQLFHRSKPP